MAPLAATADALDGHASSVRCPYEQARQHQQCSPRLCGTDGSSRGARSRTSRRAPAPPAAEESSMPGIVVCPRLRPSAARKPLPLRPPAACSSCPRVMLRLRRAPGLRASRGRWVPERFGRRGAPPREEREAAVGCRHSAGVTAGRDGAGSRGAQGRDAPAGGGCSTLLPARCRRGSLNVNLGVEVLPC